MFVIVFVLALVVEFKFLSTLKLIELNNQYISNELHNSNTEIVDSGKNMERNPLKDQISETSPR